MPAPRPFALIRTNDQWLRASHEDTALEGEVVRLFWRDKVEIETGESFDAAGAGLAFDGHCRLYHINAKEERIERTRWSTDDSLKISEQSLTVLQVDQSRGLLLLDAGRKHGFYAGAYFVAYELDETSSGTSRRLTDLRIVSVSGEQSWAEISMAADAPFVAGQRVLLVDPGSEPVSLFESERHEKLGDFVPVQPLSPGFRPRALAIDEDERLFVADAEGRRILIYDLWSNRLLRQVQLAADPVDLVADGKRVYVLLASPPGLVRLDARSRFQTVKLPSEITNAQRIALSPARELYVLENAGQANARVVKLSNPTYVVDEKFATDLDFQTSDPTLTGVCTAKDSVMVIARRPADDFARYCVGEKKPIKLRPLTARGYDGLGIVRTPDGQIGFRTGQAFRQAVAARLRYYTKGSVTTFALDSGEFQTIWGRLFLDACIPKDTEITVRCITADEPPQEPTPPSSLPKNIKDPSLLPRPLDNPPLMAPPTLVSQLKAAPPQTLHQRVTGYEQPWVRRAEHDSFETYEAPIIAGAGRYLWVLIEMVGNTRGTPRVRALRAEYPTHDYLRRLPKTLSRDEQVADFLRRYLAMFEGQLGELEGKADARATLLDPRSAPAEILPWLASFIGLLVDERMARAPRPGGKVADVRRVLIAEAIWLFRFRGTVPGLRRFVEIYLEIETILIEKFRVRGLGGALLPDSAGVATNSILGAGFRVGGAVGESETQLLGATIDDAFETHAHRFSLIIPGALTSVQLDVVNQILDLHRPAHTLVQVCTVDAGMRVGRGLHVELTSIIGRSEGFSQLQLGGSTLGRGSILGRPDAGTVIGGSHLGGDSRVG
ncbi:MAG TPA: phage tail protein [Pyrinomonadaceae bacterium]|nr:phage tail protein [Pyrinomonadaceae bacterium]